MSFTIFGLATATPPHFITQEDAAELALTFCGETAAKQRLLPALYHRTGVNTRRSVLLSSSTNHQPARQEFYRPVQESTDRGPSTGARMERYRRHAEELALPAARQALAASSVSAQEITHLITVTCSGFAAPGIDIGLISQLGLPAHVARTQIGFMGCHGAINGLRVAQSIATAEPSARILIVCVELCSLHQQYGWVPDQIVANALFADGAAALVGGNRETHSPDRRSSCPTVHATGSCVIPDTTELMSWQIADFGFEMTLSPAVPDVIRAHLRPWLDAWLASRGVTLAEIGSWAIHPGGPKILAACGESLELTPRQLAASYEVLAEYGNMSSPTVLFILERLRSENAPLPCLLLGFGPGLTVEAALLKDVS